MSFLLLLLLLLLLSLGILALAAIGLFLIREPDEFLERTSGEASADKDQPAHAVVQVGEATKLILMNEGDEVVNSHGQSALFAEDGLPAFMYPTQRADTDSWLPNLLEAWKDSRRPFLSLPWAGKGGDKSLRAEQEFWLYMYYRVAPSSHPWKGAVEYRLRVVARRWGECAAHYAGPEVFTHCFVPFGLQDTLHFKCDRFERIKTPGERVMHRDNFAHPRGVDLSASMRSVGVVPVRVMASGTIIDFYQG